MSVRHEQAPLNLAQLKWRKAGMSDNTGANCVELAWVSGGHAVRDSKNASGPALTFDTEVFMTFLTAVKAGGCDRRH